VGCREGTVVKLLLEKGADVESKDRYYGQTPLWCAAKKGHEAIMKLLLEKGADVESKEGVGQTPLSRAERGGHKAVVKLLLEKGAERLLIISLQQTCLCLLASLAVLLFPLPCQPCGTNRLSLHNIPRAMTRKRSREVHFGVRG
jgi:hypothetical protein